MNFLTCNFGMLTIHIDKELLNNVEVEQKADNMYIKAGGNKTLDEALKTISVKGWYSSEGAETKYLTNIDDIPSEFVIKETLGPLPIIKDSVKAYEDIVKRQE